MYCIIKDLMNGNPNLPEGREEEMVGHNAIAGGFQGQRGQRDVHVFLFELMAGAAP